MELQFFICRHCGNVVVKFHDSGVPLVCCGEPMERLTPNTVEASVEKHLPFLLHQDKQTLQVQVGSKEHPMLEEHHIEFVCVECETCFQVIHLKPGTPPHAVFCLRCTPRAVYAYCNIHGLWRTDVPKSRD